MEIIWQGIAMFVGAAAVAIGINSLKNRWAVGRLEEQERNRKSAENEWVNNAIERLNAAKQANNAPIDPKKRTDFESKI